MHNFTIIGAGLSGLLASRILYPNVTRIVERQKELPNNHHAVLRFRSDSVSRATGIPFKQVNVIKVVHDSVNPISDAVRYAEKVTGELKPRSIIDLKPSKRYIAPPNLIELLSRGAKIEYGCELGVVTQSFVEPVISTMPIHSLCECVGINLGFEPKMTEGWTYTEKLADNVEMYATMYFPSENIRCYRASVTGNSLMIEGVGRPPLGEEVNEMVEIVCDTMAIWGGVKEVSEHNIHQSPYQKIANPTPDQEEMVKRTVLRITEEYNIYSLGRFATWRPKLLLDDVVNDAQVIRELVNMGKYAEKLNNAVN